MIYAVLLCDKQWNIKRIKQCSPELHLQEGESLRGQVSVQRNTGQKKEEQYTAELSFTEQKRTLPAVIRAYQEADLIVIATIHSDQEFLEFGAAYAEFRAWAEDHIFGLFHNEYFMIQQMNNQLVDAKRRLTRSNRQLELALQENKEINAKLDEARILAEQASLSKTRFLANMSHDIRTPMNAIVGLSELMQHQVGNPELLKNYIAKLQSASHYLLDLINDILDFSKIENGSLELCADPMNVGVQIEQVVNIIKPQMLERKQELPVQCDCKDFSTVTGDPVRFRQILMNLFSNAVKYTNEGGSIGLEIHEKEGTAREKRYEFIVKDSGMGMSEEFLHHIFDAFSRAESEVKEIQGTGLGMAITKRLVDAMGGSIWVDSTPGKGSTFYVELPFEMCAETQTEGQTDAGQQTPVQLQGMKFLCAEDNALNAEILTALLEMEGAQCVIYENGKLLAEAFESVQEGEYDAILMDIQMPVMNGYEAAKAIRSSRNPLGKKIPMIAMTANAFTEDAERCLAAGMNAHIAKPLELKNLKLVLQQLKQPTGSAN